VLPIKISHFHNLISGSKAALDNSITADAQQDDKTSAVCGTGDERNYVMISDEGFILHDSHRRKKYSKWFFIRSQKGEMGVLLEFLDQQTTIFVTVQCSGGSSEHF